MISRKLLAIGAVAILAVTGLATVMMGSFNAAADEAPEVTVTNDVAYQNSAVPMHNLTIQVMCKVDGARAAVEGVNVTICMMNVTREENRTIVEVIDVAEGVTDKNGTVIFSLEEGKYFVFAEHNGLKGFCRGNLSEDTMAEVKMHHWNWGHMKGQKFQYMHMFLDGGMNRNGTSCLDDDHDCNPAGNMTRPRQDD